MIDKQDMQKIAKAIGKAEQKTTGEIVCVLTQQSDDYRYIPVLWAAIAALFVPLLFLFYDWTFAEIGSYAVVSTNPKPEIVYFTQLLVFLVGFFALQWPPLKFALLPKKVTKKRAQRLAAEQFMMQKVHLTDERTGVLLFISTREKYAQIIADQGIYQKLDDAIWQEVLDELTTNIKANKMAEGITTAVEQLGTSLQLHFPTDKTQNKNELPNHLIVLS